MKVKTFFENLISKWYILLIIASVSFTVSNYYCKFVDMPRKEETISIFMSTYTTDLTELHSYLNETSNECSYLREINIFNSEKEDSKFDYFFSLKGLGVADIFVLSQSVLDKKSDVGNLFDKMCGGQIAKLDQGYLNSYYGFTYDASGYCILLHSKGDSNSHLTFYENEENDENYYIMFRSNSLHLGNMNNSIFDTAIRIAKRLVEYVK